MISVEHYSQPFDEAYFGEIDPIDVLPVFKQIENAVCQKYKEEGRSLQDRFVSELTAYDLSSLFDEVVRAREALNSLGSFAEVLVFANHVDWKYLPPLPKKSLGRDHGISMIPDYLFIHRKLFWGKGHAKRVYACWAVHRRSYEVSKVVQKKIDYSNSSLCEVINEIDVSESLRLESVSGVVQPPLTLFDYSSVSGKRRLVIYEEAFDVTLEGLFNPSRESLVSLFSKLASGLTALHSKGYTHGDLTTVNIFIEHGDAPRVVMGDLAAVQLGDEKRWGSRGSNIHRPSEEFLEGLKFHQTKPGDIWSFGLVIHKVITGELPGFITKVWSSRVNDQWQKGLKPEVLSAGEIQEGLFQGWKIESDLDLRLQELVLKCLSPISKDRPTAKDLKDCLENL